MSPSALTIIRAEHQAIAAVLHALHRTVRDLVERQRTPDYTVLRALLFYLDAFPERLHHPKESAHLFKRLRACSPAAQTQLDRLDRDHDLGEQEILRLEHQLLEVEMLGTGRLPAFVSAIEQYCDRYMEHMHIEEHEILPLALQSLSAADWAAINAEFEANRDPLTGHPPEQEFEALLSRIVNLLPAPLGLGPALD